MVRKIYKTLKDNQGKQLFFYRGENILTLKRHDVIYRNKVLDYRGVDGREEVFVFTGFDRRGKVEEKFVTVREDGLFDVVTLVYKDFSDGGLGWLTRGLLDKEGFEIIPCEPTGDNVAEERIGENPKNRILAGKEELAAAISLGLTTYHYDVVIYPRYSVINSASRNNYR